jgi:superfamily II DNA/RNA helicase
MQFLSFIFDNVFEVYRFIYKAKRRETTSRIVESLIVKGHKVVTIHGAFEEAFEEAFENTGRAKVLTTTNVLARGNGVQSVRYPWS